VVICATEREREISSLLHGEETSLSQVKERKPTRGVAGKKTDHFDNLLPRVMKGGKNLVEERLVLFSMRENSTKGVRILRKRGGAIPQQSFSRIRADFKEKKGRGTLALHWGRKRFKVADGRSQKEEGGKIYCFLIDGFLSRKEKESPLSGKSASWRS